MKKLKPFDLLPDHFLLPKVRYSHEVEPTDDFIGQERAREALSFGVKVKESGYNVFVVGPTGTGRRTFVRKFLQEYAKNLPTPDDWIYVYNFDEPSSPVAIRLKAGLGRQLKRDMEKLVDEVLDRISKAFEGEEYTRKRAEIEDEYTRKKNEVWERVAKAAKELGFAVQMTPTGIVSVPVLNGKPVTPEMFELLSEEMRKEIEENSIKVKHLIEGVVHRFRMLDKEMREKLEEVDRNVALFAIGGFFDELKAKYRDHEQVVDYLEKVKEDILQNLDDLRKGEKETVEYFKNRYSVNLVVDNSKVEGAPVVYEMNPTYSNLFGKVEYTTRLGMLVTDFTMIKSGAVHRANGGFLVLDAEAVLKNYHSWDGLKRVLMSGEVRIENLESALGLSSTVTLKPQPIPVNLKVVMVGTPYIYSLLYDLDEDFSKLFKVKAEFDEVMDYNEKTAHAFVSFVEHVRQSDSLPRISKGALKGFVWFSNRLASSRKKLSARFGEIGDLIREAAFTALREGRDVVKEGDVFKAFEEMEKRVRLLQEKYDELIKKNHLMIEVHGERVGQINGLTVIDIGDHSFGLPVKITAKTFLGKSGVIDIHREADLSGKIHSKAVLTLEGFFGSRYARRFPISLAVSISFEQVYSTLEGDSASLAETLAIISAISGVPIKQGIAVTGSINQSGEVQPVGGVTEKVEGFFRACEMKGFDGTQGVIIPKANIENLVLKPKVIEAIRDGKFHIWAVESVDEAIEITMGMKAGKLTKRGYYPKGTVNRLVWDKLKEAKEMMEGKGKK